MIVWYDAQDHSDVWMDTAAIQQFATIPVTIASFGFLVAQTKDYYAIAADYASDDHSYGRITKIPKAMTKKLTII